MNNTILSIVNKLREFWNKYSIEEIPSVCVPIGAATYHPFCLINSLSLKNLNCMYLNACVRYDDKSTTDNNTAFHRYLQHYQFQVLWKNAPTNILELYKQSLEYIGFDFNKYSLKFIDSKWEALSMGAFGYGYEVYIDDLEVTQFTYFQSICDIKINTSFVEMAYGLERIAITLYNKKINELNWSSQIPYNTLRLKEEQHKGLAFKYIKSDNRINLLLKNVNILISQNLYAAALYEWLKANDNFNELSLSLSESEKKNHMQVLRKYANEIGQLYYNELNI